MLKLSSLNQHSPVALSTCVAHSMMRLVLGEPVLASSVLHEPLTESSDTHHSAIGVTSISTEMNALPGCESAIDLRFEVDDGTRI
jgi:hypothetical protein